MLASDEADDLSAEEVDEWSNSDPKEHKFKMSG